MTPNHTDYTVFQKAGIPGLNFGFIEGFENYHTKADDFERLDARSIQAQGQAALSLARYLADAQDVTKPHGNSVFLDVLHLFVLRWPAYTAWPMILLLLVAFSYSIGTLSEQ